MFFSFFTRPPSVSRFSLRPEHSQRIVKDSFSQRQNHQKVKQNTHTHPLADAYTALCTDTESPLAPSSKISLPSARFAGVHRPHVRLQKPPDTIQSAPHLLNPFCWVHV